MIIPKETKVNSGYQCNHSATAYFLRHSFLSNLEIQLGDQPNMSADNASKAVKINAVLYLRLKKLSDMSKPHVSISSFIDHAVEEYLEANHPEILKEIVEDTEAEIPAEQAKPPQKKSKKS
jgi:hypothetical protein